MEVTAGAVVDSVTGDMAPIFGRFARGEFGNDGGRWVVSFVCGGGVVSLVMVWRGDNGLETEL
jgi:hypothetical protein